MCDRQRKLNRKVSIQKKIKKKKKNKQKEKLESTANSAHAPKSPLLYMCCFAHYIESGLAYLFEI